MLVIPGGGGDNDDNDCMCLKPSNLLLLQFIENLEGCKNLQNLNLSCNIVEKIEKLSQLTRLRELNISFNKLTR